MGGAYSAKHRGCLAESAALLDSFRLKRSGDVDIHESCSTPCLPLPQRSPVTREYLNDIAALVVGGRPGLDADATLAILQNRLSSCLAAIEEVASNAARAREVINAYYAQVGANGVAMGSTASDDEARALLEEVDRAESMKTAKFEKEAVAIEAALDRAPELMHVLRARVASSRASSDCSVEIDSLQLLLSAATPLELTSLSVQLPHPQSHAAPRLIAPQALGAAGSAIMGRFCEEAVWGSVIELAFGAASPQPTWGEEEWSIVLRHLASHVSVAWDIRGTESCQQSPTARSAISVDLRSRCVRVRAIAPQHPRTAPTGTVSGYYEEPEESALLLAVYGELFLGTTQLRVPLVRQALRRFPPFAVTDVHRRATLAISGDGRVFAPGTDGDVLVWTLRGEQLPRIVIPGDEKILSVAVDDESRTLLLGGRAVTALHLDDPSAPPKWFVSDPVRTSSRHPSIYLSLTVLPFRGVVVALNATSRKACAMRLADGHAMGSFDMGHRLFACAQPKTGYLLISNCALPFDILHLQQDSERETFDAFVSSQSPSMHYLLPPGVSPSDHPIACFAGTRSHPDCVVVGSCQSALLHVLSLPDFQLFQSIRLVQRVARQDEGPQVQVSGIAADRSGQTLAVRYSLADDDPVRDRIALLPWPLLRC